MAVTGKFFVREITQYSYNTAVKKVVLGAVSRGEENKQWAAATPAGTIEMHISNQAAADHFEIGKEYLVSFTLAE